MLKAMLAAASGVMAMDLPGKNQALAEVYLKILRERDQWLTAARRFRDLADLILGLPGDNHSAVGPLSPSLALAYQARSGSELALELVYDRGRRLPFPLITRGTDGGAFSDLGPRTSDSTSSYPPSIWSCPVSILTRALGASSATRCPRKRTIGFWRG